MIERLLVFCFFFGRSHVKTMRKNSYEQIENINVIVNYLPSILPSLDEHTERKVVHPSLIFRPVDINKQIVFL